ncbi:MAG: hypothetical protein VR73_01070 [Gammaproteobacteria bacterium BRH_c0]|nr:MAG: hypothetical protein VR73_01070 [Gammaproteobacteria bacterium BRH_c0]
MIDLYSTADGASPNVYKILLLLEELDIPYRINEVRLHKGEQFNSDFLKISPNNKVPAIVDHQPTDGGEPISVFESGSIMVYLADKYRRFIPPVDQPRKRVEVMNWVFWQMAGLGPYLGQLFHFNVYAKEKIPYAITRYSNEVDRLFAVLERRLSKHPWLGGEEYSIADMICFSSTYLHHLMGIDPDKLVHFIAWHERIKQRPAHDRAYDPGKYQPSTIGASQYLEEKAWNILFAQNSTYFDKPPGD